MPPGRRIATPQGSFSAVMNWLYRGHELIAEVLGAVARDLGFSAESPAAAPAESTPGQLP